MPLRRKPIRLSPINYCGFSRFFVTICCAERKPLLTSPSFCTWLLDLLRTESAGAAFSVTAYCLMPNHLHLLLESSSSSSDLITFIKSFKQKSGYQYKQNTSQKLWQRHFYDHILRGKDAPISVAWYIWLNPVRAKLCITPQDYPFSGSFTLNWRSVLSPQETWTPPWCSKIAEGFPTQL
jgi:putative transposase